jgi:superoxide reductase
VPVVEKIPGGVKVKVGSVPHPMEEKHYIAWVEIATPDRVYRQYLKPGQAPEATFKLDADRVSTREYCTVHGLWKS